MKNIVILISGGGSNMAAIVKTAQREGWQDKFGARVAAVISNKAAAGGLFFAREHGIATEVLDHKAFASREAFDADLAQIIDRFDAPGQPALVVLAGFMRILTPGFVARYAGLSKARLFRLGRRGGNDPAKGRRQPPHPYGISL